PPRLHSSAGSSYGGSSWITPRRRSWQLSHSTSPDQYRVPRLCVLEIRNTSRGMSSYSGVPRPSGQSLVICLLLRSNGDGVALVALQWRSSLQFTVDEFDEIRVTPPACLTTHRDVPCGVHEVDGFIAPVDVHQSSILSMSFCISSLS